MHLKTNLHMHTSDDPVDAVEHSLEIIVDHAARHGFDVLAITCHHRVRWTEAYAAYAAAKGILLLGGVELSLAETPGGRLAHVLLVGAGKDAEEVRTFADLAAYRAAHPETLVVAPHPYHYGSFSLHDYFEPYAHLFDAVEHSWFYSKYFDRNRRAALAARRHNLPLLATSDTHFLNFMHDNYAIVDAEAKTQSALIAAIRAGKITNHSLPRRFVREMLIPQGLFSTRTVLHRLRQKLFHS